MPTFLMVGKLTRHENQFQDHVYPPSSTHATSRTKAAMLASQGSALEVEIEQEVTVTRDSVRVNHCPPSSAYLTHARFDTV